MRKRLSGEKGRRVRAFDNAVLGGALYPDVKRGCYSAAKVQKKVYLTRDEARDAAKGRSKETGQKLRAYRCGQHFHIAHKVVD